MTPFRYEAARSDGATVRGMIEAATATDAAALLSARGLFPVDVAVHARNGGRRWPWERVSVRAQATVFRGLASLTEAGVPLAPALQVAARVARGALAEALGRVEARVKEGSSLAAALSAEGGLFSGVTIGLVRAGERGVGLAAALERAAAELESRAELVARIRAALTYPLLLLGVGTASVAFIVAFVVPRFVAVLGDVGGSLPPATRLLLTVSDIAHRAGWLIALGTAGGVVAFSRWIAAHRDAWHAALLGLPIVGSIRHALATARAARTLGALLATGTPALVALAVAEEASGDVAVGRRLRQARDRVAEGAGLGAALAGTRAMTDSALQLVTIGEQSGRLASLLGKAAELEERGRAPAQGARDPARAGPDRLLRGRGRVRGGGASPGHLRDCTPMTGEGGRGKGEGFTMVEVLVVLALLGLIAGISGLALASLSTPRESETVRALRGARAEAIRSGVPVRAHIPPSTAFYRPLPPLFLPDGSARGPGVELLTGRPHAAP